MPTVTVGCKLPNGLILSLNGKSVTLAGSNSSHVIGGHGITSNVDKDFFDAWCSAHKDFPALNNGIIFAHEKENAVKGESQEKAKNLSGFEGANPEHPRRRTFEESGREVGLSTGKAE